MAAAMAGTLLLPNLPSGRSGTLEPFQLHTYSA
jgi:hypothetical protein